MADTLAICYNVMDAGENKRLHKNRKPGGPPRWFSPAKFGIFIHWGLYSVPAYRNECPCFSKAVFSSPKISLFGPMPAAWKRERSL